MKRWVWVLLIVSGLGLMIIVGFYQIQIDALQEPGNFETIFATQAKQILIYRSSRDNIPQLRRIYRSASKQEINSSALNARNVMVLTVVPPLMPAGGCIRAQLILHRLKCNNIRIKNCSGL